MIPSGVEIYVALEPVDMRLSFDRLSGLAKEQVGYEARSGALFIFFGRRHDSLKILFFDGSGMAIFYKVRRARDRLHADVVVPTRSSNCPRRDLQSGWGGGRGGGSWRRRSPPWRV